MDVRLDHCGVHLVDDGINFYCTLQDLLGECSALFVSNFEDCYGVPPVIERRMQRQSRATPLRPGDMRGGLSMRSRLQRVLRARVRSGLTTRGWDTLHSRRTSSSRFSCASPDEVTWQCSSPATSTSGEKEPLACQRSACASGPANTPSPSGSASLLGASGSSRGVAPADDRAGHLLTSSPNVWRHNAADEQDPLSPRARWSASSRLRSESAGGLLIRTEYD
jgi:hypothetical protein